MSHAMFTALRHTVTAAMLTPFDAAGRPVVEAAGPYAASLVRDGVGALAVGAHTGRGLLLSSAERGAVVGAVRAAVEVPVIAGVGTAGDPSTVEQTMTRAAREMADAGADALLVYPVPRDAHPDIAGLHALMARASGLPVIAFVLYEAASGHRYSVELARRLVATEGVLGIKLAALDDAVVCQDILVGCREERPDTVLFTGEDRMFGPSLMWGADAALVGIAAALPQVSVELVSASPTRALSRYPGVRRPKRPPRSRKGPGAGLWLLMAGVVVAAMAMVLALRHTSASRTGVRIGELDTPRQGFPMPYPAPPVMPHPPSGPQVPPPPLGPA